MANTKVTQELIADDAIGAAQLASNAVVTASIADDAVTSAKLDTNLAVAGSLTVAGTLTANAGVNVDNISIDGTTIGLSTGDLTLDVAGDIILDADGADILFKDSGTTFGEITNSSTDLVIKSAVSDKDMIFKGNDGGTAITALTLDMSAAGAATFNDKIIATELDISGNVDVDGTTNLDAVDIDGAVDMATTLAVAGTATFTGLVDAAIIDGVNFKVNGGQGSDGQVLTSTGSGVAWEDGGGGGVTFKEGGTNFTNSLMVGDDATGTLNNAQKNTALGIDVFAALTTGDNNVAVGFEALKANTTASGNTTVGASAMVATTTGTENVAVGSDAMGSNTEGEDNVAVGAGALYANTTGDTSVGVGHNALRFNTTGGNNVGVGRQALYSCTSGSELVGIGPQSLYTATTAVSCIAIGDRALYTLVDSPYNIAIGYKSGFAFETGASNEGGCTFVGDSSGRSVTSGKQNTFIGGGAAYAQYATTTGYRNTVVGNSAHCNAVGGNLEVVMGFNTRGIGNSYITLGNESARTYIAAGSSSWSGTSDSRLKTDVVNEPLGLSFINDLRPVKFKWKKKKDVDSSTFPTIYEEGSDERLQPTEHGVDKHGFLAQELESTLANYSDAGDAGHEIFKQTNDGTYTASPSALIPMLVKALQEADDKIDALVARVTTLEG